MNIRIATRKSKLALWQTHFIASQLLEKYPNISISLVEIVTEGDKQTNIPLTAIGGKSVFVKALQNALINNEADIAVHSIKDMSVYPTEHLTLAAICERADARDAFLSNKAATIFALPENAVIGTSSPRRASLAQSLRPDCQIALLRGNVDTRLAKLDVGNYDAIILAAAGLHRLDLSSRIQSYFPEETFTPAIGQGAIAVECRENDDKIRELLRFLNHPETALCVTTERVVNQILGGDCHTAIGAHAKMLDGQLRLSAIVGSPDGKTIMRASGTTDPNNANELAASIAKHLLEQGAGKYL